MLRSICLRAISPLSWSKQSNSATSMFYESLQESSGHQADIINRKVQHGLVTDLLIWQAGICQIVMNVAAAWLLIFTCLVRRWAGRDETLGYRRGRREKWGCHRWQGAGEISLGQRGRDSSGFGGHISVRAGSNESRRLGRRKGSHSCWRGRVLGYRWMIQRFSKREGTGDLGQDGGLRSNWHGIARRKWWAVWMTSQTYNRILQVAKGKNQRDARETRMSSREAHLLWPSSHTSQATWQHQGPATPGLCHCTPSVALPLGPCSCPLLPLLPRERN